MQTAAGAIVGIHIARSLARSSRKGTRWTSRRAPRGNDLLLPTSAKLLHDSARPPEGARPVSQREEDRPALTPSPARQRRQPPAGVVDIARSDRARRSVHVSITTASTSCCPEKARTHGAARADCSRSRRRFEDAVQAGAPGPITLARSETEIRVCRTVLPSRRAARSRDPGPAARLRGAMVLAGEVAACGSRSAACPAIYRRQAAPDGEASPKPDPSQPAAVLTSRRPGACLKRRRGWLASQARITRWASPPMSR